MTALGDLPHLLGRYGYLMLESAGMRVFGTLVAGISRMRWSTFALRLSTAVSVGLKAVLVLNAKNR